MKSILLLFLLALATCQAPAAEPEADAVDWALDPTTPPRDSLDAWCGAQIEDIVRRQGDTRDDCDLYYLRDTLYSGWACEVLPDNRHKYRYEQFERGIMIRRIGYYDNDQLDADFRLKNCKNYGPSRMWLYDGRPYIDEFYVSPGVPHGLQRQWHANGVLAREVRMEYGQRVYERKFDEDGNPVVPE